MRKIPTTERPPGSIADTCREERLDTQRQHFSAMTYGTGRRVQFSTKGKEKDKFKR